MKREYLYRVIFVDANGKKTRGPLFTSELEVRSYAATYSHMHVQDRKHATWKRLRLPEIKGDVRKAVRS